MAIEMTRREARPDRLSAFSDGVFAVVITILVLELEPPQTPSFCDDLLDILGRVSETGNNRARGHGARCFVGDRIARPDPHGTGAAVAATLSAYK
jgi:hypothetical protein